MTIATISADIVSSTSLSVKEQIEIKSKIEDLFVKIEKENLDFWGRMIKGDYLECVIYNPQKVLRIALLIKTLLKSYKIKEAENIEVKKNQKLFKTYGARISIGIDDMRLIDRENQIMDGEAIYTSGRNLDKLGNSFKTTFSIGIYDKLIEQPCSVIVNLLDVIINKATSRQCEVLFYKLQSMTEEEISKKLKIKQSAVNQHSTSVNFNAIDSALRYFEQIKFGNYGDRINN